MALTAQRWRCVRKEDAFVEFTIPPLNCAFITPPALRGNRSAVRARALAASISAVARRCIGDERIEQFASDSGYLINGVIKGCFVSFDGLLKPLSFLTN